MGFLGTVLGGVGGFLVGGPAGALAGASLGSGIDAADAQRDAARDASKAQVGAAQAGIVEQQRQFDAIQKLLAPYVTAGTGALTGQQNLIGLNGSAAQQQAIAALSSSPEMRALTQQGESAILANASATGGLRGGNTQAALAQFRPQLLAQLIQQQYGRLGGLTSIGQNAAAGVGNAGMATGQGVSALLQQQGAAQAGSALASGAATQGLLGGIGNAAGFYQALRGLGGAAPGLGGLQAAFSQTGIGGSGFGSGLAYGNQDLGAFF